MVNHRRTSEENGNTTKEELKRKVWVNVSQVAESEKIIHLSAQRSIKSSQNGCLCQENHLSVNVKPVILTSLQPAS